MVARYRIWGACAVGNIREHQEDAIGLPFTDDVRPARACGEAIGRCWAVVADGIGGHAAGEVASELAVAMMASVLDQVETEQQLRGCLQMVDHELQASMNTHPEFAGMGTTIVGALVNDDDCLVFNLGDSRAYVSSGEGLSLVSRDHSDGHYLTGCLGGSSAGMQQPHIIRIRVAARTRLLLCTDGLTNMLRVEQIEGVLAARHSHPARALVDAAVAAGGRDNVSVVVMSRE